MSNDNKKKKTTKTLRFNLSWLYILLIGGIFFLLFSDRGKANPQKVEWAEVKEMVLRGDVKDIHFVRNDYKGTVTIRPECLEQYKAKFGGTIPPKSPHFHFLVSASFDAEREFEALNSQLDESLRVPVIMEHDSKVWDGILEWTLPILLLVVFWIWMFRGMNRGMGGPGGQGGPGGSSSADLTYTAAVEITSEETQADQTYSSETADESALIISTDGAVTVTNPTVSKTGDSDGGDNCNFYGLNAAVLVKDGATVTIIGGTIESAAEGANGVFCYGGNGGQNGADGDGTTLYISDTTITTEQGTSGKTDTYGPQHISE